MMTTELTYRLQDTQEYTIAMTRLLRAARQAPGSTQDEVILKSIYLLHLAAGIGACSSAEFEDESWQLPATGLPVALTATA
jgi:hypothetical protein